MKTVNFTEAVNSEKRFRPIGYRKCNPDIWFSMIVDSDFLGEKVMYHIDDNNNGEKCYAQLALDQINGQFEIEEKKIEITESQFDEIFKDKMCLQDGYTNKTHWDSSKYKKFKRELGFI